MSERQFADGLVVKQPSENAPSFVKLKLSFKVAEFAAFLSRHETNSGWVNVDVLESKDGVKWYGVLNDYKPEAPEVVKEKPPVEYPEGQNPDDIPW